MDKIKNVIISYWFKELDFNPKDKVKELEQELKDILNNGFMYNEEKPGKLISMPRIQAVSIDKKYLFQMSLINANLIMDVSDLDNDDVILLINNKVQLFFNELKEIYDVNVVYTSIKLELTEETTDSANIIAKKYGINGEYEDFSLKRGFIKDNYYINYIINSGKEYNFNVSKNKETIEQDLFDRTLISSISKASLNKEFILKVIEINDRFMFNSDENYLSTLDSIRGMIMEIKNIINNKLYDKK